MALTLLSVMSFFRHSQRVVAMMVGLALVSVAACSTGVEETVVDNPTLATTFEPKPVINLAVNDWTASALNVAIVELIIEQEMGFPVVPVRADDSTEMYQDLADGVLDAVLEVWPSNLSERDNVFFARNDVVDIGPLGPVGQVGWYVPSYMVAQYPELSTWQGFNSPAIAQLFATESTAPRGRLLGTSPNYGQHDETLIARLGLPFTVEFSGNEAATIAAIERAVSQQEPILVWWWEPTAPIQQFDLVAVELVPVTEECAALPADEVATPCGYPTDQLFKATSPLLAEKAPEVDAFLRRVELSAADQQTLLASVEFGGKSIADAARSWVDTNEARWTQWLGESEDSSPTPPLPAPPSGS